jgi:NAD(P)-dependent dehydrogenase (short-subunit alcohol dehydrogenase family)
MLVRLGIASRPSNEVSRRVRRKTAFVTSRGLDLFEHCRSGNGGPLNPPRSSAALLGNSSKGNLASTHPRRVMTLEEVANMAVFMASDRASGMTGTTVNLTMGSLHD